jgi:hypothetical protein
MILESVITCPHCATAKPEATPTDSCQIFYMCGSCGATLRPKLGDCRGFFLRLGSLPSDPGRAFRTRLTCFDRSSSAGHLNADIPGEFVRLLCVLKSFSKREQEMTMIGEIIDSSNVETHRLRNTDLT